MVTLFLISKMGFSRKLREWRNDAEKLVNSGAIAVLTSGLSLAEAEEIDLMYPNFHFWVDPSRFPPTIWGYELDLSWRVYRTTMPFTQLAGEPKMVPLDHESGDYYEQMVECL